MSLDGIKATVAHARVEHRLGDLTGIVLDDDAFERALGDYTSRYYSHDVEAFRAKHAQAFDIITANGVTRIYRKSAVNRALDAVAAAAAETRFALPNAAEVP